MRSGISVVLESTGSCNELRVKNQYKTDLHYPVLDGFLSELNHRFSCNNIAIMNAIGACSPTSLHFLEIEQITPFIECYSLNIEMLTMEIRLAKPILKTKSLSSLKDVFIDILPLKSSYPTLFNLYKIILTIGVSSAECERSFSTLKRVKSYLRSTMTEQRLTDISVLSIEREISKSLSLDDVLTNFATANRRIPLVL